MTHTLVATCLFGLEHLLGEEIDALGFDRVDTIDGRVTFRTDECGIARANICLRYAESVYVSLGSVSAATFAQLFEGTRALPWEMWIGKNDAFPVKGHAIRSTLFSVPDCQRIVKKAIVTRLSSVYGLSLFPEEGVKYQVEFFILKDEATLMIDTSGVPLHKRGYRPVSNDAPIRETLAAAIAAISRPRDNVLFWDPMCGSGTIAIEGTMLAKGIAPGKNRSFAAEAYPMIPDSAWRYEREQAIASERVSDFEAYASDIDGTAVAIATENVRRAGLSDTVRVFEADARRIGAPDRRGTIVTNPPYGERLGTREEAEQLYREIGVHFRSLSPWQVYVITSHPGFERLYGRRADKVRKLYNGMLPCFLYQYYKK